MAVTMHVGARFAYVVVKSTIHVCAVHVAVTSPRCSLPPARNVSDVHDPDVTLVGAFVCARSFVEEPIATIVDARTFLPVPFGPRVRSSFAPVVRSVATFVNMYWSGV